MILLRRIPRCIKFSSLVKQSNRIIDDNGPRYFSNETANRHRIDLSNMTLSKYIKTMIDFKGPLSVYEYMREALTNPMFGYYRKNDVLGEKGDFITSPEISQIFGELISVWIITEWQKIASPEQPLFLIELGPGRGTMMNDILRVFKRLNLHTHLSCHLIEVSEEMSKTQAHYLGATLHTDKSGTSADLKHYQEGVTNDGVPVFWYHNLKSVPSNLSVVIAHEFFDALPIHKFRRMEDGWKEVMVDLDEADKEGKTFKYVVAKEPTHYSKMFIQDTETRDEIEVSPQSGVIMNEMAVRLEQYGGFSLIIDYGHNGELTDTFRAFRDHKQKNPLVDPGSADLTADVNFKYLKDNTLGKLISFGPVAQREFLSRMYIDVRVQALLKNCTDEKVRTSIQTGYNMLMDKNQMGERFKFISFFPAVLKEYLDKYPVAGFSDSE